MPPLSLWRLSWREWRHHPWRHGIALLAVALGVALAWSVHLINASALAEFSAAVRAANGEPDLSLRAPREGVDDALFERVALTPGVALASPLLEIDTYGRSPSGERVAVRVLGIDALSIAAMAPTLLPRTGRGEGRFAVLDPDAVFVNARARQLLGVKDGDALPLRSGAGWQSLRLAGELPAAGAPLLVMDIAGAQAHFGKAGLLTRIDLRLHPGQDVQALVAALALPPGVTPAAADAAEQRLSNLSRAYRVNLTVLALVALFVGAFLVYSVVSLSLAQRAPAFALLGVLGLTARERRTLVLAECAVLGAAGSLLGWRWVRNRAFRYTHLAAIVFVAAEALVGMACPLTVWEYVLRRAAPDGPSFVAHWVSRLLYYDLPGWVFTTGYVVFASAVAVTLWLIPPGGDRPREGL